MPKIKIVFFGTPSFVDSVLEALTDNFEVVKTVRATNDLDEEELKKLNPDLFVVAAFGKIISQEVLNIPKYGSLNIHPSLLPKYRGPSPVQASILAGDRETGVTIIKMDQKMDHGDILAQVKTLVLKDDTFQSLVEKLFKKGAEILVNLIPDYINGKATLTPQDHSLATFCKMIKKEDGYFEINNPPENLDKMIRAYYSWPGVWTKWQGKIVKLLPNQMIQMEGKTPTPLKNFLNGYPNFPIKEL